MLEARGLIDRVPVDHSIQLQPTSDSPSSNLPVFTLSSKRHPPTQVTDSESLDLIEELSVVEVALDDIISTDNVAPPPHGPSNPTSKESELLDVFLMDLVRDQRRPSSSKKQFDTLACSDTTNTSDLILIPKCVNHENSCSSSDSENDTER